MPIIVLPLGINTLMLFSIWSNEMPLVIKIALTVLVALKFASFLAGAWSEGKELITRTLIGCCAALNFCCFLICLAYASLTGAVCSVTALAMLTIWVLLVAHFRKKEEFNV